MNLNEYQQGALKTLQPHQDRLALLSYLTLGLNGEAGEVAELIKKQLRSGNHNLVLTQKTKEDLAKELGDVMWYVAVLADAYDLTLEQIAEMNLNKLKQRYGI